jgi:hypothetical protein
VERESRRSTLVVWMNLDMALERVGLIYRRSGRDDVGGCGRVRSDRCRSKRSGLGDGSGV